MATHRTQATCEVCGNPYGELAKLNVGAIVGISVGGVAVVGIGVFAIYRFAVKKKTFADLAAAFKKK